jgi:hypothetical protein
MTKQAFVARKLSAGRPYVKNKAVARGHGLVGNHMVAKDLIQAHPLRF